MFQPWSDNQLIRITMADDYMAAIKPNLIVSRVFLSREGEIVLVPYDDYVAIAPAQPKQEVKKLWVARTKEEEVYIPFGEVITCGSNCELNLQPGQQVVIPPYGGVTVDVSTNEHVPALHKFGTFFIREEEILATYETYI